MSNKILIYAEVLEGEITEQDISIALDEHFPNTPTHATEIHLESPAACLCSVCHQVRSASRTFSSGAATASGLYNCQVCGLEKCAAPGICADCLTPPQHHNRFRNPKKDTQLRR